MFELTFSALMSTKGYIGIVGNGVTIRTAVMYE